MDANRERAYLVLLSAAALHLKWDLSGFQGGLSWAPWRFLRQSRVARLASRRARAFHNLAIYAAQGWERFSEEDFWKDVDRFGAECPESRWDYRALFDAALRDEPFNVMSPPVRDDRRQVD